MMNHISIIETAYEDRFQITPFTNNPELYAAIQHTIKQIENGNVRVAEKKNHMWVTHTWIKKAISLYFRTQVNTMTSGECTQFYDKIPLRFAHFTEAEFRSLDIRVVPPACIRRGVYIGGQTVIMPSFINIGSYIGSGSMIDSWATIGVGVQIGNHVHISANACIGGGLEPIQEHPAIIEDHCFIGPNTTIVEGVTIGHGSVIGAGVHLNPHTRIYDKQKDTILYGHVPPGSVVIPGSLPGNAERRYYLNCGVIIKKIDEKTRNQSTIQELLQDDS